MYVPEVCLYPQQILEQANAPAKRRKQKCASSSMNDGTRRFSPISSEKLTAKLSVSMRSIV